MESRGPFRRVQDFDALDCSNCGASVSPKSVSAGPTVAYRCKCGTSRRINATGEQTHLRLPQPPADYVGVVGPFIFA